MRSMGRALYLAEPGNYDELPMMPLTNLEPPKAVKVHSRFEALQESDENGEVKNCGEARPLGEAAADQGG